MGNGGSKSKEEADNVKLSLKDLQDINPFLQDYNEELFKIKIKKKKNQFKHIQPLPVFVSIFFAIILFILIIFNLFTAYMYIKK